MPGIPDRHTKRASFFFPFCPPDGILITNLEKVKPLPHPGSHRKELSMKLISWNVNGLRACMQKGFAEFFTASDADIFCIQESKLQEGQIDFAPEGYYAYWNYAQKKGYSGTAIFTRKEPLSVHYGIGIPQHDTEGRVITLEFPDFYMVTCYTPNSQNELARLSYRMEWEDAFLSYLKGLDRNKPLILCGDLNVALGAEGALKDRAGGKKAGGGSGLGCLERGVIHALFLRTRGALDLDGRALDLRRSSTCRLGAVSADAEHFVHSLLHVALLVHDFLCPP